MKIKKTLEEVIKSWPKDAPADKEFTGRIGCVYPADGEPAYYIGSNLGPCAPIDCLDGYFFAEKA